MGIILVIGFVSQIPKKVNRGKMDFNGSAMPSYVVLLKANPNRKVK